MSFNRDENCDENHSQRQQHQESSGASNHSESTGSVNSIGTNSVGSCGQAVPLGGLFEGSMSSNHNLSGTDSHHYHNQQQQFQYQQQTKQNKIYNQYSPSTNHVIPVSAIRTQPITITSKHVRSRSAIDPLISCDETDSQLYTQLSSVHHPSNYYNSYNASSFQQNSFNSLIGSESSLSSSSFLFSSYSPPTTMTYSSYFINAGSNRNRNADSGSSLSFLANIEEKISKLYYRHGLLISRHPVKTIFLSLLIMLMSAYPIITYSGLFGSSSEIFITSANEPFNLFSYESSSSIFYQHEPDKIANSLLKQLSNSRTDSLLKYLYFWKNFETEPPVAQRTASFLNSQFHQNHIEQHPSWVCLIFIIYFFDHSSSLSLKFSLDQIFPMLLYNKYMFDLR